MRQTALYRQPFAHSSSAPPPQPGFTAADARNVWRAARQRILDDECVDEDLAVYDYLRSLHLEGSWNERIFGILTRSMGLPWQLRNWVDDGIRVVLPLVNPFGHLVNLQGISIRNLNPRFELPWGCQEGPLLLANGAATRVLRQPELTGDPILLTRGVDNYLALASATTLPVLALRDLDSTETALVPALRGREVRLALDCGNPYSAVNAQIAALALEFGVTSVSTIPLRSPAHDPHTVVKLHGLASLELTAVIPVSTDLNTFEDIAP